MATEAGDEDLKAAGVEEVVIAPEVQEDALGGNDFALALAKALENIGFPARQDGEIVGGAMLKLRCFRVELKFSDGEYGSSFSLTGLATQQGFHPDNQFRNGEGFLEIVVGSQVEAVDNVIDRCLGGQEEYGGLGIALADGFHHFEAGHLGHHHVHHKDVGTNFEIPPEAFRAVSFEQRRPMTQNALDNLVVEYPSEIVTGCPLCLATFVREADRPVRDIAEVLDSRC